MATFDFTYTTYQDVRRNLFKYSLPFLVLAGFATYGFILPSAHQITIRGWFEVVATTEPWKSVVGAGTGLAVFGAFAFLITEVIKLHDRWYDNVFIGWRRDFDLLFILPRLLQPFISRTNQRFWVEAARNRDDFMERLYYPFVGDVDTRIPKNRLIRFYEVITTYWLTQINELLLVLLLFACTAYALTEFTRVDHAYAVRLLWTTLVIIGLLALNRLWIHRERESVCRATSDEIQAIHDDEQLKTDLAGRFRAVCEDYGMPYA